MAIVRKDKADDAKVRRPKRDKKEKVDVDADLPDEKTEPIDELGNAVILITGEKKIGKTSLAAQFGENLVFAFEVGYKGLRIYKKDVPDWDTARALVKKIRKSERYDTVTIDTAEKSFKRCEEYSNKQLGIAHASEEEWGKGWANIRTNYEGFIDSLTHSGKGVLLISHSQEKEVKKRNGDVFDRVVSSMPKQAREIVEGIVDIWCYYGYEGDRRVLYIQGDDYIQAGHRFSERFRTPNGVAIRRIDMGRNEREAYKNFVAAWNNKYVPDDDDDLMADDRLKKKKSKFKLRG